MNFVEASDYYYMGERILCEIVQSVNFYFYFLM